MNELIIIVLLIVLNGALAMSEVALIAVRKSYLSSEVKKGSLAAKIALKLVEEPNKFLSTVQIGITIVGILTGIYSGSVLADDFAEVLYRWGVSVAYSRGVAQVIIVVLVTYLTLIFGELLPKRIGMSAAERITKLIARPMYLLSTIASPFVWLLSQSTSFVFRLLKLRVDSGKITEEEIRSMVREGAKGGEVQEVEQDIVERVFMLGDLKVSSLMTHRSDVVTLDVAMDRLQIRKVLEANLYAVYPVVDHDLDNVKGIVTLKDLVFRLDKPGFNIVDILREPSYFHENMSVYKVLEQMKEQHLSQALVFDEFGSCQGVITLKDILGGLVGRIHEAHTEPNIIKRKEGQGWLVDGQCPIYDFLSYFEREDLYANNGYNTVAGVILDLLERIPHSGDKVQWYDFSFEIIDMDGARIDKVLVLISAEESGL